WRGPGVVTVPGVAPQADFATRQGRVRRGPPVVEPGVRDDPLVGLADHPVIPAGQALADLANGLLAVLLGVLGLEPADVGLAPADEADLRGEPGGVGVAFRHI